MICNLTKRFIASLNIKSNKKHYFTKNSTSRKKKHEHQEAIIYICIYYIYKFDHYTYTDKIIR